MLLVSLEVFGFRLEGKRSYFLVLEFRSQALLKLFRYASANAYGLKQFGHVISLACELARPLLLRSALPRIEDCSTPVRACYFCLGRPGEHLKLLYFSGKIGSGCLHLH